MRKFRRAFDFLRRYFFRHPLYVFAYAYCYFQSAQIAGVHFYSKEETQELIKSGKSLIRFGDGEINILLSLNNHYHTFSPELQRMLREIVSEYHADSPYALGIPRFVNVSNTELRQIGKLNVWLPLKAMFLLRFPKQVSYLDAHNFYYDGYFDKHIGPLLKERRVILVTKEETIKKQLQNNRLPWSEMIGVPVPESNALGSYHDVRKRIDECLSSLPQDGRTILLFALGPVGKYLIYEYAKRGVQSLDIGKVAEVMYTEESIEWMI